MKNLSTQNSTPREYIFQKWKLDHIVSSAQAPPCTTVRTKVKDSQCPPKLHKIRHMPHSTASWPTLPWAPCALSWVWTWEKRLNLNCVSEVLGKIMLKWSYSKKLALLLIRLWKSFCTYYCQWDKLFHLQIKIFPLQIRDRDINT